MLYGRLKSALLICIRFYVKTNNRLCCSSVAAFLFSHAPMMFRKHILFCITQYGEWVIKPTVILPFTRIFLFGFFSCTFEFHFTIWSLLYSSSLTTLAVQSFSPHAARFIRVRFFLSFWIVFHVARKSLVCQA